jgi:vancomycin resistance protein VanJ
MKEKTGFLRWVLRVAAVGYPLALLVVVLALRGIGERWWGTVVTLYLPRWGFALPLPVIVLALALARERRLLLAQVISLLLLVFPLFGLTLSFPRHPTAGAAELRVFSFNVDAAAFGLDGIVAAIRSANPDVVMLQEMPDGGAARLAPQLPDYHVAASGQFFLASRLPIVETFDPPKIVFDGVLRSPHFVRYRLLGPQGPIQVYNVHPPSPHMGLEELRGEGLRQEIGSGHILGNQRATGLLTSVAALRTAQLCTAADDARRSADPVIIAGDTNLPGLSWTLGHCFGQLRDGFGAVGNGFGYTFPTTKLRPWMRIDRIFGNDRVRFLHFEVIRVRASDHRPVFADLEIAPASR